MDDPRWLRLITIGLILAALAVGYFLLAGKFSSNNTAKTQPAPQASVLDQTAGSSPNPTVVPTPTPLSAYARIASRNQDQVKTLPKTGFPAGLAAVFSISAMVVGFSLRKFPH